MDCVVASERSPANEAISKGLVSPVYQEISSSGIGRPPRNDTPFLMKTLNMLIIRVANKSIRLYNPPILFTGVSQPYGTK